MKLTNQRVVILGGSSGIGLETARVLAEAGAKVVIAGRSLEKVNRALATLGGSVTRSGVALMRGACYRGAPNSSRSG